MARHSCETFVIVALSVLAAGWAGVCYSGSGAVTGFDDAGHDTVFFEPPRRSYPLTPPGRTSDDVPAGDYLFLFATIADSHIRVEDYDDIRYLKAFTISPELLSCYVHDMNVHNPPVDFAVHLGDVTDLADSVEFDIARSILDSLSCPLYPVVGNHDNFRSDNKELWKQFAGLDTTNYSFDYLGYHFVVIDCTLDPYEPPLVICDSVLRAWVAEDLSLNWSEPTFILCHFNMWERGWNATFDTTQHYAEYEGMAELKQVLEQAGNVLAVINGHVHANRVEVHNDIYYIDIGATLVGPPSIRYFYVFPHKIEVRYAYISDDSLFNHVSSLCELCKFCFDPLQVCDFIDGEDSDKQFTIEHTRASAVRVADDSRVRFAFEINTDWQGRVEALISSESIGMVEVSLYDVQGRLLDRCTAEMHTSELVVDLTQNLPMLDVIGNEVYFVRARLGNEALTRKLPLINR
jgi:predicted phosphodiesterase